MSSSLLQGLPTLFGAPCFSFFYCIRAKREPLQSLKKCLKTSGFHFCADFVSFFRFLRRISARSYVLSCRICVVVPTYFWPRRAVSALAHITQNSTHPAQIGQVWFFFPAFLREKSAFLPQNHPQVHNFLSVIIHSFFTFFC